VNSRDDDLYNLIERSSVGTEGASLLRRRAPRERVESVVGAALGPDPSDAAKLLATNTDWDAFKQRVESAARRRHGARSRGANLTNWERQVARLVVRGRSTREIARQLSITVRTVENHLSNVYTKLNVSPKIKRVQTDEELKS
jgi:DNA-binding NarL/FixJ family response regulator